jgi:hypothetical protein
MLPDGTPGLSDASARADWRKATLGRRLPHPLGIPANMKVKSML